MNDIINEIIEMREDYIKNEGKKPNRLRLNSEKLQRLKDFINKNIKLMPIKPNDPHIKKEEGFWFMGMRVCEDPFSNLCGWIERP